LQARQSQQNMIILMNIFPKNNDNKMKKLLVIFVVLGVSTCSLYSQNRTIKGRVISERFKMLIGVPIMINDTDVVGKTDLNGFFQIDIPVSVKKMLFWDIGFEKTVIELTNTCDEVEVIMLYRDTYDFTTPRKVDKLRMKIFKKLPEFCKEAFEKGLFKTNKACYTQEFISVVRKNKSDIKRRE